MNAFGVSYENLRGTNYLFNSSLQKQADFSLLSSPVDATSHRVGTYSPRNVESELAAIADAGFNNLRIWLPFFGWIIDPLQFRSNLRDFVQRCRRHRLTLTWVFWTGIGNGVLWDTQDLIEIVRDTAGDVTNDELYKNLEVLTEVFQKRHGHWVPNHKPWHVTGYPAPGNNLLRASGEPDEWHDGQLREWVAGYVDALLEMIASDDGRDTLFHIDLANEFDGVRIPLAHTVAFAAWNQRRIRAVLPDAPLTIGWAVREMPRYEGYVRALDDAGVNLDRHSFHVYVREANEYAPKVLPLIEWSEGRSLPLMATEFYRIDTPEWGHLQVGLRFFESHRIPTTMWGFVSSNIYDDPNKPGNLGTPHVDGVVTARNLEFDVEYAFEVLNTADHRAVLDYNARA